MSLKITPTRREDIHIEYGDHVVVLSGDIPAEILELRANYHRMPGQSKADFDQVIGAAMIKIFREKVMDEESRSIVSTQDMPKLLEIWNEAMQVGESNNS